MEFNGHLSCNSCLIQFQMEHLFWSSSWDIIIEKTHLKVIELDLFIEMWKLLLK